MVQLVFCRKAEFKGSSSLAISMLFQGSVRLFQSAQKLLNSSGIPQTYNNRLDVYMMPCLNSRLM